MKILTLIILLPVAAFAAGKYIDAGIAWFNDDARVTTQMPKFILNSKLYVDGQLIEIGFRSSGEIVWRVKK